MRSLSNPLILRAFDRFVDHVLRIVGPQLKKKPVRRIDRKVLAKSA